MNATADPKWAETPPLPMPDTPRTTRTLGDILDLATQLRNRPGEWVVYSDHKTRNAARQRISQRQHAPTLQGLPLEWRSRRLVPGDTDSRVEVLVRWQADEDGNPVPAAPGSALSD